MSTFEEEIEKILKILELEYLDIYLSQVEFKKGYQGYDAYRVEIIDEMKQLFIKKIEEAEPKDKIEDIFEMPIYFGSTFEQSFHNAEGNKIFNEAKQEYKERLLEKIQK